MAPPGPEGRELTTRSGCLSMGSGGTGSATVGITLGKLCGSFAKHLLKFKGSDSFPTGLPAQQQAPAGGNYEHPCPGMP